MQNNGNQDVLKLEVFHGMIYLKKKINSQCLFLKGSDRHILILRSKNNIRIADLMDELQRITTVPVENQKLYYRGQELHVMKERTIRDIGLDNNAQVRLIGEPTKRRYEAMMIGNHGNEKK